MLKLDFAKVYDKLNWSFLFDAMEKMGMFKEFIKMVKLLFKDVVIVVCLNGCITKSFKIERGVRQGCPLAPYLFLIIREVLNFMFK
jgi:hypothetical protein